MTPRNKKSSGPALSAGLFVRITLFALAGVLSSSGLRAELIPAARLVDWTAGASVGVPGGVDAYLTGRTHLLDVVAKYGADATGASDAQPAIQAAINASVAGDVIYLPAGTYRIGSPISVGTRKNITLRGAGPDKTILMAYSTWGPVIDVGTGADYQWRNPDLAISGSPTKGTTVLNVGDTSVLNGYPNGGIGQLCQVSLANDPALPVISVSGYERVRRQKSRIIAKTATTITISPGLHFDLPESLSPHLAVAYYQTEFVGIEDMKIDGTNGTMPAPLVSFAQAYACWLKNVTVTKTPNYLVGISHSLRVEVRHCDLRERQTVGTNGAGIMMIGSASCLVEDNIIYRIFPHIEINDGSSGNVFAYNFCESNDVYGVMGASIDSNHNPHNSYNLFEGNVASKFQSDAYFGSESEALLFRNWFHGTSDTTDQFGICINLNRFARNFSVVGNVLGRSGFTYFYDNANNPISYGNRYIYTFGLPSMGNGGATGYGPPWTDGARDGVGTISQSGNTVTATSNFFTSADVGKYLRPNDGSVINATGLPTAISSVISPTQAVVQNSATSSGLTYSVWPGHNGYQELDTDVARTTVLKGNYNYANGAVPTAESLGADPLPASMYRSSKPAWFGSLTWPAFDPANPQPAYTSIPAGYRFVNGTDPLPQPGGTQPPPPSTGSGQLPLNVRIAPAQR